MRQFLTQSVDLSSLLRSFSTFPLEYSLNLMGMNPARKSEIQFL